jgi:APA family basic amino acid/polyamine antiporter
MGPVGLTLFGLGAGIVSMLGIMNAHMLWGSRSVLMVCRDGWFPVGLGRANRFGAPTWPLVLLAGIGAVPVAAGLGVADVIRVSALGATGSAVLSVVCAAVYAREDPVGYAGSPFAVPVRVLWGAVGAALVAQGVTLLVLLRDLPVGLTVLWVGWFGLGLVVALVRRRAVTF